jgi:hypothetical protein
MSVRQVVKLVYKVGMIAVTIALVTLAYLAYRTATPANGQLLICGILAILALITFLSIWKLDWQDEEAATYRGILDEMRARLPLSIRFGKPQESSQHPSISGTLKWSAREGVPVTVGFAEPEVHRMDAALLNEAKRMAASGTPIDDICRMIDPDHDRNAPVHQEVFRNIVRAAIEQD